MRFPYRVGKTTQPVWTLAGRMSRPRPIIDLTVLGPKGPYVTTELLDTGADDTIFPDPVAAAIGLDLVGAPQGTAVAVGGQVSTVSWAEVELLLMRGGETRQWKARVGFTATPRPYALLGFAGFLQFFTATFHGDQEAVDLVVNGLYPGN
jgi:hypothetical protein